MTDDATELTLEEKAALAAGTDLWHTFPVERLGIPVIKMTDGPVGARGAEYVGGPPSTCFPCGTALAASWDTDLVRRVGAALGDEAIAKGAHVLLAPTVNIHRTPLAGRNFECFSEDPHLTARMAVAYIGGVQSRQVAACVKHFVCNDSEFERHTISSEIDERTLREIYLRPFEAAVLEAGTWSLMGAYNKVNGTWCCEHPRLLTGILRDEWAWDGVVVSDWWATHTTADAANAGLDIEMPGPPQHMGPALAEAVRGDEVAEAVLDDKVRRLRVLAERTGAAARPPGEERSGDAPERRALAREAAAAGIVLLQNDRGLLPLEPASLRRVAVVGPNADAARILGGGSAAVTPPYLLTPYEALVARLPDAVVVHEAGCTTAAEMPALDLRLVGGGLDLSYVAGRDPSGPVAATTRIGQARMVWREAPVPGVEAEAWSARLAGELRPRRSGRHELKLRTRGQVRLWLDDELVVDGWDTARSASPVGSIELEEGRSYRLRIDLVPPAGPIGALEIRCGEPVPDDQLGRAVAAAADADVAIVVVGLDSEWESEGHDRPDMSLPGGQAELVARVAAANPRTVVVVNAGAAVDMEWAPEVPAIVQLWYAGQEGANALADVLLGDVNPSGRLPTTFPVRLDDVPAMASYPGGDGRVVYEEGVFVGYRGFDAHGITPRFPFGHGLSYTTFGYGELRLDGRSVEVDVANTGPVAGAEVVQLYVADIEASVPRPPQELAGFAKVRLDPGEKTSVRFELDDRAFSFWEDGHRWRIEPGEFEVRVGPSSRDIRARARLTI
jgi:beta-glucosidase